MLQQKDLLSIPRFSGLESTTLNWLSERIHKVEIKKSNFLFMEGDKCDALYIVESGSIKVFKSLENGKEITLDIFYHGDAVGEVALIDEGVFPASAIAMETSFLFKLSKKDYLKLLTFRDAVTAIIRDLTLRMRGLNRRVHELGSGEVEQRLAHVVLTISQRSHPEEKDILICDLNRQELASLVGARLETVIRIVSRWHKEGMALKSNSGLHVRRDAISKLLELK